MARRCRPPGKRRPRRVRQRLAMARRRLQPLPGARVPSHYDDFSTPCYDGQHQMILGGSWISCGDEASVGRASTSGRTSSSTRASTRRPGRPRRRRGQARRRPTPAARCAKTPASSTTTCCSTTARRPARCPGPAAPSAPPPSPSAAPAGCSKAPKKYGGTARALDIGCAVGGAASAGPGFGEVLGVDLSRAFIDAANQLQKHGSLDYFRRDEATWASPCAPASTRRHRPLTGELPPGPTPPRCPPSWWTWTPC